MEKHERLFCLSFNVLKIGDFQSEDKTKRFSNMYIGKNLYSNSDTTKLEIICVLTNVHESWPQQNDKKTCKILHKYFYKQTQQTIRSVILQQNR